MLSGLKRRMCTCDLTRRVRAGDAAKHGQAPNLDWLVRRAAARALEALAGIL